MYYLIFSGAIICNFLVGNVAIGWALVGMATAMEALKWSQDDEEDE